MRAFFLNFQQFAVAVAAIILLGSCAGIMEEEKVDQAQLQRDAVLPDPNISLHYCPAVETGLVMAYALPPISERACGHPAPFAVQALLGPQPLRFSTEAKLNCVMASQLQRFFSERVQPLAMAAFGQPVVEARIAASYSCRTRNNKAGGKLSEHAKTNAIDISALTLADGTEMTVQEDWGDYGRQGRFLRAFNREACKYFTTVIGPGGDNYHQDHIHLDHARHGKEGLWRLCQ